VLFLLDAWGRIKKENRLYLMPSRKIDRNPSTFV